MLFFFILTSCSDNNNEPKPIFIEDSDSSNTTTTIVSINNAQTMLVNTAVEISTIISVKQNIVSPALSLIDFGSIAIYKSPSISINSFIEKLQAISNCLNPGVVSSPSSGTAAFDDYCILDSVNGNEIILNGTISLSIDSLIFSILFTDFTVSYLDKSQLVNFAIDIDIDPLSSDFLTVISSPKFIDYDGESLTINDFKISEDGLGGYQITGGTMIGPFGVIDIAVTTPIKFNCPVESHRPSEGVIQIDAADHSAASIHFSSCDSFDLCVNDSACKTIMWADVK